MNAASGLHDCELNHVLISSRMVDELPSSWSRTVVVTTAEPHWWLLVGVEEVDEDVQFDLLIDRTSDRFVDSLFAPFDETPVELMRGRSLNVTFVCEAGIDGGVVSREFFFIVFEALLSRQICDLCAFYGARGHLPPTIDQTLTNRSAFRLVGVLVVQAERCGCRGLPGLSDAVRHFLIVGARISAVGRSLALVNLDDVTVLELRAVLVKVSYALTLTRRDVQNTILQIVFLIWKYKIVI